MQGCSMDGTGGGGSDRLWTDRRMQGVKGTSSCARVHESVSATVPDFNTCRMISARSSQGEPMALWPEEYEGFRDEARQMADALRGHYGSGASGRRRPIGTGLGGFASCARDSAALETTSSAGRRRGDRGCPVPASFRPKLGPGAPMCTSTAVRCDAGQSPENRQPPMPICVNGSASR